jgi:thymidylate kinase
MSKEVNNFICLVNFFKNEGIDYAILGRRSSLNEIVDGDIDIVISYKNFNNLNVIMQDFASNYGMQLIQCLEHESTAKYFVLSDRIDHSIICPDFCSSFIRDKRLLIKNEELMENRTSYMVQDEELSTLVPEYEFLYYLLKKIDKNSLDIKACEHLVLQFRGCNTEKLLDVLRGYFSNTSIELIISAFEKGTIDQINQQITLLRRELYRKKKIKFSHAFADLKLKVKRLVFQTGLSVAILGTDGSGKSTVIRGLSEHLKKGFRKVQYYHLYPKEPKSITKTNVDPQGQKPHSLIISQLKLLYFAGNYHLGYFKVYLKLVRSTLIIFDRYFDDILVDKLRFRYNGPRLFLKIVGFFIPKPKLYLYLDAPSQVIFSRKKELTIDEIERQQKEYLALLKKKKRGYIINAEQVPEKVIFDSETKILDYLEKRQKNRI